MTTRTEHTARELFCLALLAAGWVVALLAVATLLAAMASPARAAVLTGSTRTSLYTRELGTSEGEEQATVLLQHLKLDLLRISGAPLSFHGALSERNLLERESLGETHGRLYRAYARWTPGGQLAGFDMDLRAGRHWVLGGVGTGALDGVSLTTRRRGQADATFFFGTLGAERSDVWRLDGTSDSRRLGGRVRWFAPLAGLRPNLGASFEDTRRDGRASSQRLGVTASVAYRSNVRVYGEWRQNLIYGTTTGATAGLELSRDCIRKPRAYVEYERRRPDLDARSAFAAFESGPVCDLRSGLGLAVCSRLRADFSSSFISRDGEARSRSFRFALSSSGIAAGYRLNRGFGGDLAGLVLTGHEEWRRFVLDANVDLVRYQYGEVEKTDDGAAEGSVSLGYRLRPNLLVRGQWEGLDNARFVSDHRFLGVVEWRFRARV